MTFWHDFEIWHDLPRGQEQGREEGREAPPVQQRHGEVVEVDGAPLAADTAEHHEQLVRRVGPLPGGPRGAGPQLCTAGAQGGP